MTKMKIVYPWSGEGFSGSKMDKQTVVENLTKLGYPYEALCKNKPAPRLVSLVNQVVTEVMSLDDANKKVPWVLALSNSTVVLQALAKVVPVVWVLTKVTSCYTINSSKMVDMFMSRKPTSMFEPDPADDVLSAVRTCHFLVWEDLIDSVPGAPKQAGRFTEVLKGRLKLPTLFTVSYTGEFSKDKLGTVLTGVEHALGSTARSLVSQHASIRNFYVKGAEPSFKTVEV